MGIPTKKQKERYAAVAAELGVELPPLGEATPEQILSLSDKYKKANEDANQYHIAFNMQLDVRSGKEE